MCDKKIPIKELQLKSFNVFIGHGNFAEELIRMSMLYDSDDITEDLNTKGRVGYFERLYILFPEKGRHPTEQYHFIKDEFHHLLTHVKNNTYEYILIFTQSPYILTSLNNLIQKHNAGLEGGLNFNDIGCWDYNDDHTFTDVLNYELKLISNSDIDSISETIGREFDKYTHHEYVISEKQEKLKELQSYRYC